MNSNVVRKILPSHNDKENIGSDKNQVKSNTKNVRTPLSCLWHNENTPAHVESSETIKICANKDKNTSSACKSHRNVTAASKSSDKCPKVYVDPPNNQPCTKKVIPVSKQKPYNTRSQLSKLASAETKYDTVEDGSTACDNQKDNIKLVDQEAIWCVSTKNITFRNGVKSSASDEETFVDGEKHPLTFNKRATSETKK